MLILQCSVRASFAWGASLRESTRGTGVFNDVLSAVGGRERICVSLQRECSPGGDLHPARVRRPRGVTVLPVYGSFVSVFA